MQLKTPLRNRAELLLDRHKRRSMQLWRTDKELFELAEKELFTCVVGDVLDKQNLLHQYLPPEIRPLSPKMTVIGRAMPVLASDVFQVAVEGSANPLSAKPFGLMLEALDDLQTDEVYISTGSSPRNALWGELMSVRALYCGARGAILNGYVRDTSKVLALGFPTFCFGSYGQDSAPRYKVNDFRIPIEIGGVAIRPGDIVFGDIDGVVVIPAEAATETFALALEKVRGERTVRKALEEGMSAVAAFRKHGIM
jgi:regulator of RNase E activity RraA